MWFLSLVPGRLRNAPLKKKYRFLRILNLFFLFLSCLLTLIIHTLLSPTLNEVLNFSVSLLIVLPLIMFSSCYAAKRFEGYLIDPVLHLAEIVGSIDRHSADNIHIHSTSMDEVGTLYRGVNLLVELRRQAGDQRDAALHQLRSSYSELSEQRSIWQSVVDHASSLIAVKDATGRYITVNHRFEQLAGKPQTLVLDKRDGDVFPAMVAEVLRSQEEELRRYGVRGAREVKLELDGGTVEVLVEQFLLPAANGEEPGVGVIGSDITELKFVMREREELLDYLVRVERMQAVGKLAGGIAHDFNNLIFAIAGFAEHAKSRLEPDSAVYGNLSQIITASNRARDLVEQLLTFSSRKSAEFVDVDLQILVRECVELQSVTLPQGVSLSIEYDEQGSIVRGDSSSILRMLGNLCRNAIQAISSKGQVEIKLSTDWLDNEIRKNGEIIPPGRYRILSVKDSGQGMSPEDLRRLFEPFYTSKPVGQGTGLGMSVVYGIVRSHGAYVTVDSERDKGTEVKVYFSV